MTIPGGTSNATSLWIAPRTIRVRQYILVVLLERVFVDMCSMVGVSSGGERLLKGRRNEGISYTTAGADVSNSDGAVMDMLWQEERGNAHAETMRLREKGKRMARFIHYFTRFVRVKPIPIVY